MAATASSRASGTSLAEKTACSSRRSLSRTSAGSNCTARRGTTGPPWHAWPRATQLEHGRDRSHLSFFWRQKSQEVCGCLLRGTRTVSGARADAVTGTSDAAETDAAEGDRLRFMSADFPRNMCWDMSRKREWLVERLVQREGRLTMVANETGAPEVRGGNPGLGGTEFARRVI